jgi:hypothetical protein
MAKRGDSIFAPLIMLIFVGGFALFWISGATKHGAPALFPLFGVVFLLVAVTTLGRPILQTLDARRRNGAAAVLTAAARVAAKRIEVSRRGKADSTAYYATFDLTTGERLELELAGKEYGLLAEGDHGELRYQGTWYLGFERGPEPEPEHDILAGEDLVCEYCGTLNGPTARKCASCGSGRLVRRVVNSQPPPAQTEA